MALGVACLCPAIGSSTGNLAKFAVKAEKKLVQYLKGSSKFALKLPENSWFHSLIFGSEYLTCSS